MNKTLEHYYKHLPDEELRFHLRKYAHMKRNKAAELNYRDLKLELAQRKIDIAAGRKQRLVSRRRQQSFKTDLFGGAFKHLQ